MINNKFLIGISMGVIGTKFYGSFKNVIKPKVVKILGNTIELGENTKKYFMEITKTAQELNKESYKKINYASINENKSEVYISKNIDNLKLQLTEIQKQLSKL
jgi:hypothetical protein